MSASWPPDFKKYESLSNDDLVKAITSESQNKQAPTSYTQFFEQLTNYINLQKEHLKKQKALNDNHTHSLKIAETNYNSLTTLYEEEHERYLDIEEKSLDERIKYESEIKQVQHLLTENLNAEKQKHDKTKEKHAVMRMKMEQEFVQNMRETQELKQKLKEAELKIANLEKLVSDKAVAHQQFLQQQYQQQQDKTAPIATVSGIGNSSPGSNNIAGMNGSNNNLELEYFYRYFQNTGQ